jgi:hypothetical protein
LTRRGSPAKISAVHPTLLADAVDRLATATLLDEIEHTVRSVARQIVDADGATFVLRDGEHCFYADEDAISPLWKGQRFPLTQCISGWSMLNDEIVQVPDITLDDRIPIEAYRPTFVKSLVMVPFGADVPVGAIGTYWAALHQATPAEIDLLRRLAAATGAAVSRVGLDDAPFLPSTLRTP